MHNSLLNRGKAILQAIDSNGLFVFSLLLLVFIPLWPKIPLFSPIEQYIVRVRIEDILILIAASWYGFQVLRRKSPLNTPLTPTIFAYAVVGALSVLAAMFVIKTVPLQPLHIGKTVLHYFRYLEYFSLFFIAFAGIKDRKQLVIAISVMVLTVAGVSIYGYGQKNYYWPVYSTMNREFSKGVRLYLTEHARVQSTFGGHYDLAAYLVIVLPLVVALAFSVSKTWQKVTLHLVHLLGLWAMIVSASRTSFVAYLAGLGLVLVLTAVRQTPVKQKLWWFFSRSAIIGLVIVYMFFIFGDDMYERFVQTIQAYPKLSDAFHNTNAARKNLFRGDFDQLVPSFITQYLPKPTVPENAISTDEAEAMVLVSSDERPVPVKPSDVYVDVPDIVEVATVSASGEATKVLVDKGPRVYSDNALKHGLSLAIRLDTLWPQAIKGFMRNPITGSGYATLNKASVTQFTEAESTDNNFLRTLGETGLGGFVSFYGTVLLAMWLTVKLLQSDDELLRGLGLGFIAGSVGLLLNAVYIDVFAASKVAQTYWALTGIVLAALKFTRTKNTATQAKAPVEINSTEAMAAALGQRRTASQTKSKHHRKKA